MALNKFKKNTIIYLRINAVNGSTELWRRVEYIGMKTSQWVIQGRKQLNVEGCFNPFLHIGEQFAYVLRI